MKTHFFRSSILSIYLGFIIWLLGLFKVLPYSFFELSHVQNLLIAAPLWIIPLAFYLEGHNSIVLWLALLAGLLFTISYQLEKGYLAAGLILPWLSLIIYLLLNVLRQYRFSNDFLQTTKLAAYLYLPVGILWAFIDRLGIPFLGYDPTIILLTAIHFHYAGFLLPMTAYWLAKERSKNYSKWLNVGIVTGIPLVAVGISATHFQWPGWIEVICVSIMAGSGTILGMLYFRYGIQQKSIWQKISFTLGGFSLLIGMSLALCYGWRHFFLIETLTIPWMYAVHGTCNALGFAVPITIGWFLRKKVSNTSIKNQVQNF